MSEQERGLTDNEIIGILKGAVKTAITYEAADAILATISILRNEIVGLKAEVARSQNMMFAAMEGMRSQGREIVTLRRLLSDLAYAANSADWEATHRAMDPNTGLLGRIYEVLGEKRQ